MKIAGVLLIGVCWGFVIGIAYRTYCPVPTPPAPTVERPPVTDLSDKITDIYYNGQSVPFIALTNGEIFILGDVCPAPPVGLSDSDVRRIERSLQRAIDRNERRDVPVFDHQ